MPSSSSEERIAAAIETAESIPEAVKILAESGYPINEAQIADSLSVYESNGELSEDDLDLVSGGAIAFALKQLLEKLRKKGQSQGSSGAWHSGSGRHG